MLSKPVFLIRMEFLVFDDYWLPLISEGPVAKFVAGLSAPAHATLVDHVQRTYLAYPMDRDPSRA
jgi:hypothetical protein